MYGFPCEMDFSLHESPNPTWRWGQATQVVRNPSHLENHTKQGNLWGSKPCLQRNTPIRWHPLYSKPCLQRNTPIRWHPLYSKPCLQRNTPIKWHPLYSTCLQETLWWGDTLYTVKPVLWWENTLYTVKPIFKGHSDGRTPLYSKTCLQGTLWWEDTFIQ